jgi:diphthine-ammonia ligase
MCGIIGFFNHEKNELLVKQGMKLMQHRGNDAKKIQTKDNYSIGHLLHAIINHVPQPLTYKKETLAINCEIYNWKELKKKYNIQAKNDAELVLKLLNKKGIKSLEELDGDYAFSYIKEDKLFLARDIIGVKPIWFSTEKGFSFASEKKAVQSESVEELNPREIIEYDLKKNKIKRIKRNFFKITPTIKDSKEKITKDLGNLFLGAVKKRIPDGKFGLLFSGGLDSSLLALLFKKLNLDFTCYTAVLDYEGFSEPLDLKWAKGLAKKLKLKHKIIKIKLEDVEDYFKKTIETIEDAYPVKVAIGATLFAACEAAKKDKMKVIFSGLGSEEIFAGYKRHEQAKQINKECISGLLKTYEKDTYRDDTIAMKNNLELRVPFLDKELVEYALRIPREYKISGLTNKVILREVALSFGLNKEHAGRKGKATQYGSKFDRAMQKLAKNKGFKNRADYLAQFRQKPNLKLGALFSSGKDSSYALWVMMRQNYEISCLITIKSKNPHSYMFHTPNIDLVDLQAKSMNIPLVDIITKGVKEKELEDLEKVIKTAKKKYKLDGIITGALYSDYQRKRIEKICEKLGLKVFSPLWHLDQEQEMRDLIKEGFKITMSSIAADGLDSSWVGKIITEKDVDKLVKINQKIGINIAGEGGEYESLVLDAPMFKKQLKIIKSEVTTEGENIANLIIKKAILTNKNL